MSTPLNKGIGSYKKKQEGERGFKMPGSTMAYFKAKHAESEEMGRTTGDSPAEFNWGAALSGGAKGAATGSMLGPLGGIAGGLIGGITAGMKEEPPQDETIEQKVERKTEEKVDEEVQKAMNKPRIV